AQYEQAGTSQSASQAGSTGFSRERPCGNQASKGQRKQKGKSAKPIKGAPGSAPARLTKFSIWSNSDFKKESAKFCATLAARGTGLALVVPQIGTYDPRHYECGALPAELLRRRDGG